VTAPRTDTRIRLLGWFALVAPPIAWTTQHVVGYGVTEAACGSSGLGPNVNAWTIVVTVIAATIAVLALVAAVSVFRATRAEDTDGAPPAGRIYFLSILAMTTTPLFLLIMLMDGAGVLILQKCHQG
jgi:hypothetical protein